MKALYRASNLSIMNISSIKWKSFITACLLIVGIPLISFGHAVFSVFLINFFIIFIYILFKPKNIFHPNNIIFAFSFLYIVVPSSIQLIYEVFELPYMLPWGKLYDIFSYENSTYYNMLFLYLVFYFSFYFFNQNDVMPKKVIYLVNEKLLFVLLVFTLFMLIFYMQLTGGFVVWITSYKEAFLLGRDGLGVINFIVLFSVNLLVFLLGLYFHRQKGIFKFVVLLFSLLIIVSASFLQGIKSRIIILLLIFFFPYLLQLRLKIFNVLILGLLFFGLLFIGNYIRSDGFYDSPFIFIEYMMTYFNVYDLHNMVALDSEPGFFSTLHHVFIKPMMTLGLVAQDASYDLSVTLTKEHFPADWETMKATQQWPLITELYYNYYGFLFGWFPLVVYAFILSFLYKKTKSGNIALALIFILEFFRLFTVQRGVLIPWQMPIYLFFYLCIYFIVKTMTKVVFKDEVR